MPYHQAYRIGPYRTPFVIKLIVLITIIISFLSAFIAPYVGVNYFLKYLGLSYSTIKLGFVWQIITYSFLQPSNNVSLSFITHIIFNMYLLWIIGSSIIERRNKRDFLILFFGSSIFSAIITLIVMFIAYPNVYFSSTSVVVYASLFAWMMLYPDMKVFLFFSIPLKITWLVIGLIGFNLFIDLANLQIINFFSFLSAAISGYFFGLLIWKKHSPFHFLHFFERPIISFSRSLSNKSKKK